MKSRLSALYKAIRRLLTDHCVCVQVANPVCVERDVEGVLRDFLCSPYENGSFWCQSTGSDLQLFGSGMQHEDNLFGPRLGCIRAFLNAVYEDSAYVAYNSRSVRLQEAGFVRTQLEQDAGWRAGITFETGQPNAGISVLLTGEGDGHCVQELPGMEHVSLSESRGTDNEPKINTIVPPPLPAQALAPSLYRARARAAGGG